MKIQRHCAAKVAKVARILLLLTIIRHGSYKNIY